MPSEGGNNHPCGGGGAYDGLDVTQRNAEHGDKTP